LKQVKNANPRTVTRPSTTSLGFRLELLPATQRASKRTHTCIITGTWTRPIHGTPQRPRTQTSPGPPACQIDRASARATTPADLSAAGSRPGKRPTRAPSLCPVSASRQSTRSKDSSVATTPRRRTDDDDAPLCARRLLAASCAWGGGPRAGKQGAEGGRTVKRRDVA
jgi:hypothetical protein